MSLWLVSELRGDKLYHFSIFRPMDWDGHGTGSSKSTTICGKTCHGFWSHDPTNNLPKWSYDLLATLSTDICFDCLYHLSGTI